MAIKTYYLLKRFIDNSEKNLPFYIENLTSSSQSFAIMTANSDATNVEYSTDNSTWSSTNPSMPANGRVYIRANATTWSKQYGAGLFQNVRYNFNVGGNIMSLFYGSTFTGTETAFPDATKSYIFYGMFSGNSYVKSAEKLALPATTLAQSCYEAMFKNCTALTTAPDLPATTLAQSCYNSMFFGCTSLTTAPTLPATTLAQSCYEAMFKNCTALTTAPDLPATTLAQSCYNSMFFGCTSLTTAPALPATTLAQICYQSMFSGCTSLTTAPALPATTLVNSCYGGMFSGCTSLTTAPTLPATTLVQNCYESMFQGCSQLSSVSVGATSWDTNKTAWWLYEVSATGTFTKPSGTTIPEGANGIPSGWTVVNV